MKSIHYQKLIWPGLLFLGLLLLGRFSPHSQAIRDSVRREVFVVVEYGLSLGLGFALAWFCARLIDVFVWQVLELKLKTVFPRLLKDMVTVLIFVITGIAIAKWVFDQDVTAIWATSGVLALVMGLALRNLIADLFCGIALSIDQPFKIGEWLEVRPRGVDPLRGCVVEMSWRTTRIRTTTNTMVVVPNSLISTIVIINLSRPEPTSRFDLVLCFDFGIPSERLIRVLTAGVKSAPDVLVDPAPKVLINRLTQFGVEYKIRYWIDPIHISPRRGRHQVASRVLEHLYQAGITPAYSKQDIYLSKMPVRELDRGTDRVALVRRVELFSTLSEQELNSLATTIQEVRFESDAEIVRQGESGDSMYILVEGLLAVYSNSELGSMKLNQILPGQFFGEMSLLTGENRSATVVAMTDVILFEITREVLSGLLEQRPAMAEEMSRVVAYRRNQAREINESRETIDVIEPETLASQLLEKMKDFFSVLRGKISL